MRITNHKELLLIGFALVVLIFSVLYGIGKSGLFDEDEAYYSEVSREMVETNNYIIPEFNYLPFYHKPILFYWFQSISYKILGVDEFSSRIPSALFMIILIAVTYLAVSKLFSKPTGIFSSIVLATNIETMIISKAATMDMALLLFISCSLYAFLLGYFYEDVRYYYCFYVCSAIATLIKGPVGLILPAIIVFLFLLLTGNITRLKEMKLLKGILLFSIITLPWYIGVTLLTNGDFAKNFFLFHNIARFSKSFEGHSGGIFYYVIIILFGFYPWSSFLPSGIVRMIKRDKKLFFILLWLIIPFMIFSTSSTKLPNYILPVFPALSIIVGIWWNEYLTSKNSFKIDQNISMIIFAILTVILSLIFGLHEEIIKIISSEIIYVQQIQLGIPALLLSFLLLLFLSGILLIFKYDLKKYSFAAFVLLMLSFNFILMGHIVPKAWKSLQGEIYDLSIELRNRSNENSSLVLYNISQPSIIYYSQKKAVILSDGEEERLDHILANCRTTNKKVYIVTREGLSKKLIGRIPVIKKLKNYMLLGY